MRRRAGQQFFGGYCGLWVRLVFSQFHSLTATAPDSGFILPNSVLFNSEMAKRLENVKKESVEEKTSTWLNIDILHNN